MPRKKARIFSPITPIEKDTLRVAKGNPWNLKNKDKVRILGHNFSQLAKVEILNGEVNERDLANIQSSNWVGESGAEVECERITNRRYIWDRFSSSGKLKFGLGATAVTILAAYGTAALTKDGYFQPQLGWHRWILLGLAGSSAIVSWAKDF